MIAIINDVVVIGNPKEIKNLIDMYEIEKKYKDNKTDIIMKEIKRLDQKFNSLNNPFKSK